LLAIRSQAVEGIYDLINESIYLLLNVTEGDVCVLLGFDAAQNASFVPMLLGLFYR
jgi:hypothetical protein